MRQLPQLHDAGASRHVASTVTILTALGTALALAACATHPRAPGVGITKSSATTTAAISRMAELPREQTADQQVRHTLNRLAFGGRPGDAERIRAMGVDQWIARQLEPERIDDRATQSFLTRFPTLTMSSDALMREYPTPAQLLRARMMAQGADPRTMRQDSGRSRSGMSAADSTALRQVAREARRVAAEIQTAKVARAVMSERQLEEVMVDFWQNHFSVFAGKGPVRYMLASYDRDVIRANALGNFRELLGAVAKHPAMLFYLDNYQSAADSGRPVLDARGGARDADAVARRAGQPGVQARRRRGLNENYGRELLELHTLGVDGGYTQADVIDVARALTGWTIDAPRQAGGGNFIFRPRMHDAGAKRVLGHTLTAGRGMQDGEQVLDIVANHPSTARTIAAKLARRFVSDSPPPALVHCAAETFRRTKGDIRETVRTIVTSPEFFSSAAYKSKVKSPFEVVVSALRAVGAPPDSTPRTAQVVARLGQPLFGHQAPNGYPETGEAWINTGAILNRINFGLALAGGRLPGVSARNWPGADSLASASRAVQVDVVVKALLGGEASPDTRRILTSGVNPLAGANAMSSADSLTADLPQRELKGDLSERAMKAMADAGTAGSVHTEKASSEMNASSRMIPRGKRGRGADPLGAPANLDGLAQIVGLALGAPEFQRR